MEGQEEVITSDSATSASVSAPENGGQVTQPEASGGESVKPEGVEEEGRIPMSRWNQKLQVERQLRAEAKQLRDEFQNYKQAIEWHKSLQGNPELARKVSELISGRVSSNQHGQEDDLAELDPRFANRFKKVDELEAWKSKIEEKLTEKEKQERQQKSEENRNRIDNNFVKRLKEEGLYKDGLPQQRPAAKSFAKAVLAELTEIAADPQFPTEDELDLAYQAIQEGFSDYHKYQMSKATRPTVPASGSGGGAIPAAKTVVTKDDITNFWANSIGL